MKVSILIPCYNAERWVREAIASALDQDYPNKEVVVVDDGSTDGSRDEISSFGNRIRTEFTENRGGNAARNLLLTRSTGEWLQYLDADDYLEPNKISRQMSQLDSAPNADVWFGPSLWRFEDIPDKPIQRIDIPSTHDPWILLVRWYLPQTGSPLWRKRAIQDVDGWNEKQAVCQEHELYFRLLAAGKKFQYADISGAVYRHWSEDTVCRRDKISTYRERLRIIDRAEEHLHSEGWLTLARQNAINQSRFVCARIVWERDPELAESVIRRIYCDQKYFKPDVEFAPMTYRLCLQMLGFGAAEKIAASTRRIRRLGGRVRIERK